MSWGNSISINTINNCIVTFSYKIFYLCFAKEIICQIINIVYHMILCLTDFICWTLTLTSYFIKNELSLEGYVATPPSIVDMIITFTRTCSTSKRNIMKRFSIGENWRPFQLNVSYHKRVNVHLSICFTLGPLKLVSVYRLCYISKKQIQI